MKVLFVASECAPFAKVGGLADVVGALPKFLKASGVDVRICLPKYRTIDLKKYKFRLIAGNISVKGEKTNIYQGFLPGSQLIVYLLENKKYFSQKDIYSNNYFDDIKRFLFFSQAVLEIFPAIKWFPNIINCHDWHAAIITSLLKLKTKNLKTKTLLTIHNLAQQGKWNAQEIFDFLNLKGNETENLKSRDRAGDFNILQQGILNADLINTVSPNYAKEILTQEYGEGMEKQLFKRKKQVFGILNGIDEEKFNPQTDSDLKLNYSLKDIKGKTQNKIYLQKKLNLRKNDQVPLLGLIGRLDPQKGIDLIIEIIPDLIKKDYQLIILGKGDPNYEKKLLELSQKYPQNISSHIKFDAALAQKIYAGSDIFLIPSKFEPCGLIQMIAMRYGTIPVARKTGGLADTIEEGKTGFLFEKYNKEALWKSIGRAVKTYQDKKEWTKLIQRAMRKDFSWKKSALKYRQLYKQLLQ